MAVANTTELFVVNLTNPSISLLKLSIANIDELHIVESSNGPVIAVVSGGSVELYSISGQNVDANWWADDNVTMLDSIGDDIVYVTEGNPTELRFAQKEMKVQSLKNLIFLQVKSRMRFSRLGA